MFNIFQAKGDVFISQLQNLTYSRLTVLTIFASVYTYRLKMEDKA